MVGMDPVNDQIITAAASAAAAAIPAQDSGVVTFNMLSSRSGDDNRSIAAFLNTLCMAFVLSLIRTDILVDCPSLGCGKLYGHRPENAKAERLIFLLHASEWVQMAVMQLRRIKQARSFDNVRQSMTRTLPCVKWTACAISADEFL